MNVTYTSTRGSQTPHTASAAILKGLAEDGGLFVPDHIPALPVSLEALTKMTYQETAYAVMHAFLTDYTEEELKECIDRAYDDKFDVPEIAPIVRVGNRYHLELFHGATIAFKDMALSILPHLMVKAAAKNHMEKEIVILTATSGDTGKAALAGFADVPGTKIIVFYPKAGVSAIQEKQMLTQKGDNTHVVGIHGNFDDAQTGVKQIFGDKALEKEMADKGFVFSSANSINIGRLVPQVVYYVYAYARLTVQGVLKAGDPLNVVVPTGNFGNILAAFYAKEMGIPIGKLICASNENKVLFDFFGNGCYDRNRPFVLTSSPSMDILISSNLERLIYWLTGANGAQTNAFMEELKKTGRYEITDTMVEKLKDFAGFFASETQTEAQIAKVYRETGYVMDTHTAVASSAADQYEAVSGDHRPVLVVSTASPYKFAGNVVRAIAGPQTETDDFVLVDQLEKLSGTPVPQAVEDIRKAPILHHTVCDKEQMVQAVRDFLKI